MNEQEALAKMVSPGMKRANASRGGIIQIHLTRACTEACVGCTQGSNLGGKPTFISSTNFEKAVLSLKDYFGIVGIFGGCPTMHPKFDTFCELLRQHIPKERCGLWANDPLGHGAAARITFNPAVSNLNVHLDQKAYDEFKRDWPECNPFGLHEDSRHSPPYVALQDVIADEGERWDLIAGCDINKFWSAMICEFRGEARAFFCELAGAQAMLHQHESDYPDLGHTVEPGWWRKSMQEFAAQARYHCHACGVPLRGYGSLAQADDLTALEQVSATHANVFKPKRPGRLVQIVTSREELGEKSLAKMTDYVGNAAR